MRELATKQAEMKLKLMKGETPRQLSLPVRRRNATARNAELDIRKDVIRVKINKHRVTHGLLPLADHENVVSSNGICVRCNAEQMVNSQGRFTCWFCRNNRHDLIETERAKLREMDARHMPYSSTLTVRLDSTLFRLNPGTSKGRRCA